MKKIYEVAVILGIALFLANIVPAFSQATITHYDATGNLDTKRPDFTKAVIAIDFGGPIAEQAINMFLSLHVQNFSLKQKEGGYPCQPSDEVPVLVCLHITAGPAVQQSEWGSAFGNGRNGGSMEQSSFNGTLSNIFLTATIIRRDADGRIRSLDIGYSYTEAPAGSSYTSIMSYGKNSSGGITNNVTSGLDATIGNAVSKDLGSLFQKPGLMGVVKTGFAIAQGARPQWLPGADQNVARAFTKTNTTEQLVSAEQPTPVAQPNELDRLQQ